MYFFNRFSDGTTCETVYFDAKTVKNKREIIKRIVDRVAGEKLGLSYMLLFDQFEDVLIRKTKESETNEDACLKIITIADELNGKLRLLKLPLEITDISANSDVFK